MNLAAWELGELEKARADDAEKLGAKRRRANMAAIVGETNMVGEGLERVGNVVFRAGVLEVLVSVRRGPEEQLCTTALAKN